MGPFSNWEAGGDTTSTARFLITQWIARTPVAGCMPCVDLCQRRQSCRLCLLATLEQCTVKMHAEGKPRTSRWAVAKTADEDATVDFSFGPAVMSSLSGSYHVLPHSSCQRFSSALFSIGDKLHLSLSLHTLFTSGSSHISISFHLRKSDVHLS